MSLRVRVLAWLMWRGPALLQLVGFAAIAVGIGALFGWPVGLIVAGIETVLVGVLLEMRSDARTPS